MATVSIVARGGGEGAGVLIVDDLVDTGQTAKVVRALLPRAHFAAVYAKPMGRPLVDTFIANVAVARYIAVLKELKIKWRNLSLNRF